jgi:hypothetical protein
MAWTARVRTPRRYWVSVWFSSLCHGHSVPGLLSVFDLSMNSGWSTLFIRTPRWSSALTASCSANDSRACWYKRRRSSSGTPSRNWMYNATTRTLLALLETSHIKSCRIYDDNVHDIPAIEECYHVFHQCFRRLAFRSLTCCAVLRREDQSDMDKKTF